MKATALSRSSFDSFFQIVGNRVAELRPVAVAVDSLESARSMLFPTTCWTDLAHASLNGDTVARSALEGLCQRYWTPVYGFVRARRYSEAEAEDLTQGFFVRILESASWKRACPTRGRFRTFLLGAVVHFLMDEKERRNAAKRGGGEQPLSLDELPTNLVPSSPETDPARVREFDRAWAVALMDGAMRNLEAEFREAGAEARFTALLPFLPVGLEQPAYETAAASAGLTLSALKTEVLRLRRRFRLCLRAEVARTVDAPHEIDAELAYLQEVLLDPGHDFARNSNPA